MLDSLNSRARYIYKVACDFTENYDVNELFEQSQTKPSKLC